MTVADGCGHAYDLAHHARCAHNADGTEGHMRAADVASGHEKVVNVARIEATVRYGIGMYPSVYGTRLERLTGEVRLIDGIGEMQVNGPCSGE